MPAKQATNDLSINDKHKLLGLDHLRALAITWVLLFHFQLFGHPAWVSTIGSFGWTGVDLFFVLSGFLISGQLFAVVAKGKSINLKEFVIKRFFRIIPPYLLILILYTLIPYLHEREQFASLWRYLTFTLNFDIDLRKYGTFTHAWSLCVEEQFYLLLPLMFLLFGYLKAGRKAVYLIIALFIGGLLLRLFIWNTYLVPVLETDDFGTLWHKLIYYPTYNRLDGLLVGVSIAGIFTFYPNAKNWVNRHHLIFMFGGLALLVFAYIIGTPSESFNNTVFGFPLISISYGSILAAVVSPKNIFYSVKSFVTSQIATLSYAIYLSHKLIIHLVQDQLGKLGMDKNSNLMMLCCVIGCIAGAIVIRFAVEKPALALRNRILK